MKYLNYNSQFITEIIFILNTFVYLFFMRSVNMALRATIVDACGFGSILFIHTCADIVPTITNDLYMGPFPLLLEYVKLFFIFFPTYFHQFMRSFYIYKDS